MKTDPNIPRAPEAKKVLLIEPSSIFGHALTELLKSRLPNVDVALAKTLGRADELLEAERPDIVFLDICVFPKNGVHHIKSVKQRLPRAKVVVLTTHDSDEHKTAALEGGADCFLSKHHVTGTFLVDFIQGTLQ